MHVSPGTAERSSFRRLADAALAITRAGSVEEVLKVTTEAAQAIVGAHQAVTSRLVHGWQQSSTHVALSDKYAAWRDFDQVPAGLGVLNYVTRENRPLRLTGEELAAHPEFRGLRDAPGHPPLPDYLAAPLVGRTGANLGLIQLSDKVDGRPFDADDEAAAVQLAQLASAVLETMEALDAADREARRARALEEVGRAIAAQRLELQEVVQLATDKAVELTGAEFGAFFYNVNDPAGEVLTLYTLSGAPREAFERFPMPRKTQIFAPTFDGTDIVRIDDVLADPRYGRNPPYEGMPPGHLPVRSHLAVPVITDDGEVAGGMFFGHPDTGHFTEEHEAVAVGIASQAAVALVNARLYRDAQSEIVERDRIARTLQESLLPPELPEVEGIAAAARYRSGSSLVGGDFYDLFPVGGSAWGVVIGDVCGRGPEAAARTALTRHTVRTAAMLEDGPAAVLRILNEALVRHSRDRFATAVFGRLEPDGRGGFSLCFASGGHPPLAILRAGGDVETAQAPGAVLGVLDDVGVEERTVELEPGDAVVLYTDGLFENRSGGEVFGEDRLLAALGDCAQKDADDIADCLLAASEAFAPGDDDTALLVLVAGRAPAA